MISEKNVECSSSFDKFFKEYPGVHDAYVISLTNGKTFSANLLYQDDEGIIVTYKKTHPFTVWINRDNICSISGINGEMPMELDESVRHRNRHTTTTQPFYMDTTEASGEDDPDKDESL